MTDRIIIDNATEIEVDVAAIGTSGVATINGQFGVVVLDADDIDDTSTTHKFVDAALISKVSGIEAGADVTDTTNVTAAGALMDSEVDADIKTLSLPANTTISAFGATLVDDADAAAARTTLGAAPLASPTFTGSVVVPAGDAANEAAQITAYDAATGRIAIGAVEMGNTGWRTILQWDASGVFSVGSAFSGTGWEPRTGVAGYVRLRRTGSIVTIAYVGVQTTSTGPTSMISIPAGFRNASTFLTPWFTSGSAEVARRLTANGNVLGRAQSSAFAVGDRTPNEVTEVSFVTVETWPSSLPGSEFTVPFTG